MKNIGRVRGTMLFVPEWDDTSSSNTVYHRTDIIQIIEPDADKESGFRSWEYSEVQYTHNEYIEILRNITQSAIGELSVIQAQYQNQNEVAIAELSMLFAGGVKNV